MMCLYVKLVLIFVLHCNELVGGGGGGMHSPHYPQHEAYFIDWECYPCMFDLWLQNLVYLHVVQ